MQKWLAGTLPHFNLVAEGRRHAGSRSCSWDSRDLSDHLRALRSHCVNAATDEANSRNAPLLCFQREEVRTSQSLMVILVGKVSLKVMCSLALLSSKHMDDAGASR